MIVEQRYLAYILRERHRQLSTWIYVAEQYIANGISCLATSEPYIEDSRYMFLFPVQCQRATGKQSKYYRLACF